MIWNWNLTYQDISKLAEVQQPHSWWGTHRYTRVGSSSLGYSSKVIGQPWACCPNAACKGSLIIWWWSFLMLWLCVFFEGSTYPHRQRMCVDQVKAQSDALGKWMYRNGGAQVNLPKKTLKLDIESPVGIASSGMRYVKLVFFGSNLPGESAQSISFCNLLWPQSTLSIAIPDRHW